MKRETKYQYEKRIKELQSKVDELNEKIYCYKTSALEIYDGVINAVSKNETINRSYILERLKRCFK